MIRALIFDAEGVVIDTEPAWDRGQAELLQRRGLPYDRERLKPLLTGSSLEEGVELLKRELGLVEDTAVLAQERMDLVHRAFAEEAGFISGFREFFAGAREVYRTAIATSLAPQLLALVDNRLGLTDLFGGRLYTVSDVAGRGKPCPDLFLHTAQQLGMAPGECLVLEDALYGIMAAKRAGMPCIALATTYPVDQLREADYVVADYKEIPAILARI